MSTAPRPRKFTLHQLLLVSRSIWVDLLFTLEVVYYSVFPAEACKTIGGEACDVEMYPEVKLKPEAKSNKDMIASEQIDREYLEYNSPKT